MERFGYPNELDYQLFLSSDSSSFVTGSEVTVDGGFSCMIIHEKEIVISGGSGHWFGN